MVSLETVLDAEACNSEAPSLIGRKSLKGWISDRFDPAESGDSGESVPGNPECSRRGHLINSRPQIRLIMHRTRIVSSSRMTRGEESHPDPTPPGRHFFSCDMLATRSVHAARWM